jgi:hypothetical protein
MKCDSRPSLLARTFISLYLGYEPKAKVATTTQNPSSFWRMVTLLHVFVGIHEDVNNAIGRPAKSTTRISFKTPT